MNLRRLKVEKHLGCYACYIVLQDWDMQSSCVLACGPEKNCYPDTCCAVPKKSPSPNNTTAKYQPGNNKDSTNGENGENV